MYTTTLGNDEFNLHKRKQTNSVLYASTQPNKPKNQLLLRTPPLKVNYSPKPQSKIQRELTYMGKTLNKDNASITCCGLHNRPILNLHRGEFDFSMRSILEPPSSRRVMTGPYFNRKKTEPSSTTNKTVTSLLHAHTNDNKKSLWN